MSFLEQLPKSSANYQCDMDNLFTSAKFANVCYNGSGRKVMIHGACQQSQGIPKSIIQEVVTRKDVLREKRKVKVALLRNDTNCKNLVALSFYDNKPVYFISMACENVMWLQKTEALAQRS